MTRTVFRASLATTLLVGAFFFALLPPPASAAARQPSCQVPTYLTRLDRPLAHASQKLMAREPLKIVAIGSSSTAGAGASSPAASYPSRLAVELRAEFRDESISVVNRGINGQDAAEMLARLDDDVIGEKPDLVIWQLGTNAALRDIPIEQIGLLIEEGVRRLKAAGTDVLLIDPQFAPRVIAKPEAEPMVKLIAAGAAVQKVGVFHRFAIMRHWREVSEISFDTFITPDGLHMNDWGYDCWAKLLSAAIVDAATRSTASAQARPGVIRPNNRPPTQ